jgi:hypothetical protein
VKILVTLLIVSFVSLDFLWNMLQKHWTKREEATRQSVTSIKYKAYKPQTKEITAPEVDESE